MVCWRRPRVLASGLAGAVLLTIGSTPALAQSAGCAAMNGAQSVVALTAVAGDPTDSNFFRSTLVPSGAAASTQYFNDGDVIRWSYQTSGDAGVNLQARRFSPLNVTFLDPPGGTGGSHPVASFSTGSRSGVFTWGVDNTTTGTPNRIRFDITGSSNGGGAVFRFSCTPAGQAAPAVTAVSPSGGTIGSSVTISGSNFTGAYSVRFGSTEASFTLTSATSIMATVPSGSGTVDITVSTGAGTSASAGSANDFTYPATSPVVSALSPPIGTTSGGGSVVLTGSGFTGATAVRFGTVDAEAFTVTSATSITATPPPAASGTVDVTVVTPAGTSATGVASRYSVYAPPNVTGGYSPSSIAAGGSATLTLTVTNPNVTGLSDLSGLAIAAAPLPTGLTGSSPATNCPGGVATYGSGSGLGLAGATLAAGASCTVTLSVTASSSGSYGYTSGVPTASGPLALQGAAAAAAAPLTVTGATQTISFTSGAPTAAVVGGTAYTPTATATSGLVVTFSIDAPSATVCRLSGGVVSFIGVGACRINADQAGDATFAAAPRAQQSFVVGQGAQAITFTSTPPAQAVVGGAGYTPTATATSGLTATFSIDASSATVCRLSGGVVSFIGAGACRINADQAGDANYTPAAQAQQSFAVEQASQTISFTSAAPVGAVVGEAYTPAATATSGLVVILSIDPTSVTVCSITGGAVSFTGIGTCRVNANQSGDATYAAAPQVQQSFVVGQATQTIIFTSAAPSSATVGGTSYTPSAAATSGLVVTFSIDASSAAVCTLSGGTVSFSGAGTCRINAGQAGDANYAAAPTIHQAFAVNQGSQTISFTTAAPTGAAVGGATYVPAATATSGLPVTFTIDATTSLRCSISGGAVSFTAVGTCRVNATQVGNANYTAAQPLSQSIEVGPGVQAITFTSTPPPNPLVGGPAYTPAATASSGLPVTFAIDVASANVCSISGGVVSLTGVGTCRVNADQAGNDNYTAAPQAQQSFVVGHPSPIAGPVNADVAFNVEDAPITLNLTGGPTTSVAIVSMPTNGTARATGAVVTYTPNAGYFGPDSFTYTATGPGGTSSPATVSLTVATSPATVSLTVATPPAPTAGDVTGVTVGFNAAGQVISLQPAGVFTSVQIATAPTNGTVTLNGGTATYVPNAGYFGLDSFT